MISFRRLFQSFRHALRGVALVFRSEQSFQLQTLAGIAVLLCAWAFRVTKFEWLTLFVFIGAVLSLELINSVFERIMDVFKPRLHPAVRDMKDIMAGVVLLASLAAGVVGAFIFLPHFIAAFRAFAAR